MQAELSITQSTPMALAPPLPAPHSPFISYSMDPLLPFFHFVFVLPWLLNMMLYPGAREETQRLATSGSCSHWPAERTMGEGTSAQIQEPELPNRSHGSLPSSGASPRVNVATVSDVAQGRRNEKEKLWLPSASCSPTSHLCQNIRRQGSTLWNAAQRSARATDVSACRYAKCRHNC